jgi:hypothetical protein
MIPGGYPLRRFPPTISSTIAIPRIMVRAASLCPSSATIQHRCDSSISSSHATLDVRAAPSISAARIARASPQLPPPPSTGAAGNTDSIMDCLTLRIASSSSGLRSVSKYSYFLRPGPLPSRHFQPRCFAYLRSPVPLLGQPRFFFASFNRYRVGIYSVISATSALHNARAKSSRLGCPRLRR